MSDTGGAGNMGRITPIGGGYFNVGGKKVTFGDMVFMAQLNSIDTIDQVFATKYNEVQKKNDRIQEFNKIYADLNTMKEYAEAQKTEEVDNPEISWKIPDDEDVAENDGQDQKMDGDSGKKNGGKDTDGHPIIPYDFEKEFFGDDGKGGWNKKYFETGDINVKLTRPKISLKSLDAACTATQSNLNSMNSQTSLDMMQLNRLSGNRSTGIQLISSLLSTLKEARQTAART